MNALYLATEDPVFNQELIAFAQKARTRFRFVHTETPDAMPLRIGNAQVPALFQVDRDSGVLLSRWQSEGICLYASIEHAHYFLLCSALGLVQWSALQQNPLLVPDDFVHAKPARCLFSSRATKESYALLFEEPHICQGCVNFYRCLGIESETALLLELLGRANKRIDNIMYTDFSNIFDSVAR